MGIDDLDGTLLFKELGTKRVVLSREVEIEKVKEIRRIAKIPLEIFVHGALCVSYLLMIVQLLSLMGRRLIF